MCESSGLATTTISVPGTICPIIERHDSRKIRFVRLRITALPIRRLTENPNLMGPSGPWLRWYSTNAGSAIDRPPEITRLKSSGERSRWFRFTPRGGVCLSHAWNEELLGLRGYAYACGSRGYAPGGGCEVEMFASWVPIQRVVDKARRLWAGRKATLNRAFGQHVLTFSASRSTMPFARLRGRPSGRLFVFQGFIHTCGWTCG